MFMKKILTIVGIVVALIIGATVYLFVSLKPVSKKEDLVVFTVQKGYNKIAIADSLKTAGLVRSKYATIAYMFLLADDNLQAGTYEINRGASTQDIIKQITSGDIMNTVPTVRITFVEGKTLEDYAKQFEENFNIPYTTTLDTMKDKIYLQELIKDYWFLDDSILNKDLYYGLEGYLAPDTYEFFQNSSLDNIIRKMLDNMEKRLEPLKEDITASGYSVHQILSLASIVEKEGNTKEDRGKIAQVLYKRLELGKGLGCDVTTYYAVHKGMKEPLYYEDLMTNSPYNTSELNKDMAGKIPVGPICNPGLVSISSMLHPSKGDYLYFIADVDTGEVFFFETYAEFNNKKAELNL